MMLDGSAIGSNGVGGVVEKNDGVGFGRVLGELLLGGSANPVGNAVLLEGKSRRCGEKSEKNQGKEVHGRSAKLLCLQYCSFCHKALDALLPIPLRERLSQKMRQCTRQVIRVRERQFKRIYAGGT